MTRLADYLRHDLRLRLTSLVIAILLWAWRSDEGNPLEERRFGPLPVEAVELPRGLVTVGQAPAVELTLRGPRHTLDRLATLGNLRPTVDCGQVTGPSWPALPIDVETPANVEVKAIDPAEWEVEIDALEVEVRPVVAELGGSRPPAERVYEVTRLSHTQAQVAGPRKLTARTARVVAEVDLTGRAIDFSGPCRLRPVDAVGQPVAGVACEPRTVTVTVKVVREEGRRELPVTARFESATDAPRGYVVEPSRVTVRGSAAGLAQLGGVVSTLPVGAAELRATGAAAVGLALPDGVTAEPAMVRVRGVEPPAGGGG